MLIRNATPADLSICMDIRGRTKQNAIPKEVLESLGITVESWTVAMNEGNIIGNVSEVEGNVVGFTYGDTQTGEVLVLAILADYEGKGIGKALLETMVGRLKDLGHQRLWLATASDPEMRSHGFYRKLGWTSTGEFLENTDEILELFP